MACGLCSAKKSLDFNSQSFNKWYSKKAILKVTLIVTAVDLLQNVKRKKGQFPQDLCIVFMKWQKFEE